MSKEKEKTDETVESQKLSARDKREIQEGACVNCAVASFVLIVLTLVAMLL
ncbi:MAG: hypothetical protein K9W43_13440 [Candidatus Thorarchaeota archaeon]|nr:hypothetical protein [Candidatus Thorarchaeota archaeon]